MSSLLECFHCEEWGHWANECPLLTPPDSKAEHERRFNRIMERFHDNQISLHGKRRVIETENKLWDKKQKEMAKQ